MYVRGIAASILIVLFIGTSGCSFLLQGPGNSGDPKNSSGGEPGDTLPTLPEQYSASPVITRNPGSLPTPGITITQLPILSSAEQATINGTGIANSTDSDTPNSSVPVPVAKFSSTTASGFAPLTVQFTDTSLSMPTAWHWDFGDSSSSVLQNPAHTYLKGGQFSVNFIVSNEAGSSSLNATSYVSVYEAGYSAAPDTGTAPLTVIFTDTGTGYPPMSAWYWDFGDGITSGLQNTTHQYVTPGSYDVKFRVSGASGTTWVNRTAAVIVT